MTHARFEQLVEEALASLPEIFRNALENIAIVIEDHPTSDQLDDLGIDPPDTLLGLYEGTPLTERQVDQGGTMPDRVTLFQKPIEEGADEEKADGEDAIVVVIGETLIHEIGHYFGLDEDAIQEIEERYWRGNRDRD